MSERLINSEDLNRFGAWSRDALQEATAANPDTDSRGFDELVESQGVNPVDLNAVTAEIAAHAAQKIGDGSTPPLDGLAATFQTGFQCGYMAAIEAVNRKSR